MNAADFRRIALCCKDATEGAHMGAPDFRVGGRIFATLAHQAQGYGNLLLSPEQQTAFIRDQPEMFLPVAGGWGKMGATHVVLECVTEPVLTGALRIAWKTRLEKNGRTTTKRKSRQ